MNNENILNADLTAKSGVIYPYTKVTGYIYASGADTKTAFPNTKTNDQSAPVRCHALLMSSFAAAGFSFADGILARIVAQRGNVARVVICGKTDVSYLVTDGTAYSHGGTLNEARDGLLYKVGSRDTSEFKSWTLDHIASKRDAIKAYRAITGACEGGVKSWVQQRNIPESITVQGIIDLTKGAYGADEFRKFFEKSGAGCE